MTFDEYWERLCKASDSLRQEDVRMSMTVSEYRRTLKMAFEAGMFHAAALRSAAKSFGKA